ncbi:hypothetical protein BKA64DRAFT_244506 [Cadophora sp. MPI-SDFR-AT-0126]|nr:hypothetical protein BKA64DRAFT_244506 [Leotiomycetes sp. MPI-SDFR-AT-0126]
MCEFTHVEFRCGDVRYTVRAWCTNYEKTHIRCPPWVVAIEYRLDERCGNCRTPAINPSWITYQSKYSGIQTENASGMAWSRPGRGTEGRIAVTVRDRAVFG